MHVVQATYSIVDAEKIFKVLEGVLKNVGFQMSHQNISDF